MIRYFGGGEAAKHEVHADDGSTYRIYISSTIFPLWHFYVPTFM